MINLLKWMSWPREVVTYSHNPRDSLLLSIVKNLTQECNRLVRPRSDEKWYTGLYLFCFEVVVCTLEFVPDGFQDRSKGGDPNSCSNQHSHFILENILTGCAKGTIHFNPGRRQKITGNWRLPSTSNLKHPPRNIVVPMVDFCIFILILFYCTKLKVQGRIAFSFLPVCILVWDSSGLKDLPGNWWILLFKSPYEIFCPVPCCSDMNGEEIFLWSRGQSKRMPFQGRDWGAINKDILPHFHAEATLVHLQFQNFGWVHNNLVNEAHRPKKANSNGDRDRQIKQMSEARGLVTVVNYKHKSSLKRAAAT